MGSSRGETSSPAKFAPTTYNQEAAQISLFRERIRRLLRFQLKVLKYKKGLPSVIEVIASFCLAIAFLYSYRVGLDLDTFIPLLMALYIAYDPVKKLGMMQNQIQEGRGALERLDELMREPVTIRDPERPREIGRIAGNIIFDNVSFAYDVAPVLRQVNVRLPQNQVYALVGPSGAGKSTFANLIPLFFDPAEGAVTIDGIDIREMRLNDLRRNIAFVSQDRVLFDDTIVNNIRIGRPDASNDEVVRAAEAAHAREFIETFEDRFDTLVFFSRRAGSSPKVRTRSCTEIAGHTANCTTGRWGEGRRDRDDAGKGFEPDRARAPIPGDSRVK